MSVPFSKGFDPRRNQRGRGKGKIGIPDLLRRIGEEGLPAELVSKLPEEIRNSRSKLEALMRTTYYYALKGESWAVQFIADRTEGKVKDTLALEGGQRLEIVEEIIDAKRVES